MLKIYNILMFCQNAVNQYVISLYFSSTIIFAMENIVLYER